MPEAYAPPYQPRARQLEALEACAGQAAFALLMEMRTGKTKVVLDDFGRLELEGLCDDLAVIAPGGAYKTWEGQCREHLSIDLLSRVEIYTWRSGMNKTQERELKLFLQEQGKPRIFLINVEALSTVVKAREALTVFLSQRVSMCAIDEATIIANPSAKRTKFINGKVAPLTNYRRILSGLISPKGPLDVYSPFEFLSWRILGHRSYYSFRARYAIMANAYFGGRTILQVVGYRNIEELQAKMKAASYRCLLSDCYDLPPSIYIKHEVELTPEQRRVYDELKAFATSQITDTAHISASVIIAQIIRLHQVLMGYAVTEDGEVHELPQNRTSDLISILQETEEKAIIWCAYDQDIRRVSNELNKAFGDGSTARFWGGNPSTREQEELVWKTNPSCRFMVATAAAGGRGRTWDAADLTIYYANTFNLEHRDQSESRPKAVSKSRPQTYIDMMVPGTVDEVMIKSLREKINMATAINGDNWREWLI